MNYGIFKGAPLLKTISDAVAAIFAKISDSIDVFIQDQSSAPIDYFFTRLKAPPTTVAIQTVFDSNQVTVTDGTNCNIGDYVGIFNGDDPNNNRAYFGTILSKPSVNVVILDTPLDFNFKVGDTFACFSRNINDANGTLADPVTYEISVGPNATQSIDITRLMFSFITDDPVSLSTFGDIDNGLTNGCVLRRRNGIIHNIFNIKTNGELVNLCFDYDPYTATNPAQGQNGAKFRYTFNGQDKHGVVIRLEPGDALQFIVQDDLTSIQQFRIIAEGHFVVT